MPLLISLADVRDVFIIIYGAIGIIFFVIASLATLFLFLNVRKILRNVNGMLDEQVKPAIGSVREAAETVRGTTEFVGKNAISPVVRVYGAMAGVRRGLGVLSGMKGKKDA